MKRRADRLALYEAPEYREIQRRIAANVLRLRKARGWTHEQAAHACGMSAPMFFRLENERLNLTLVSLGKLVRGLEIDAKELFDTER